MNKHGQAQPSAHPLLVVIGVALVCGLLVSVTAVNLKERAEVARHAEKTRKLDSILQAVAERTGETLAGKVEARIIDLDSGQYDLDTDPLTFNQRAAATDPRQSRSIATREDVAGIRVRENKSLVYLLRNPAQTIIAVILPVRGVGYQSALYGYLALDSSAREILALKFYEQNETPGLGSQIQDPAWEALWPGKLAYDDDGLAVLGVGKPGPSTVAAISGATRTSDGVDSMMQFWLGDQGFGPFLAMFRTDGGS